MKWLCVIYSPLLKGWMSVCKSVCVCACVCVYAHACVCHLICVVCTCRCMCLCAGLFAFVHVCFYVCGMWLVYQCICVCAQRLPSCHVCFTVGQPFTGRPLWYVFRAISEQIYWLIIVKQVQCKWGNIWTAHQGHTLWLWRLKAHG